MKNVRVATGKYTKPAGYVEAIPHGAWAAELVSQIKPAKQSAVVALFLVKIADLAPGRVTTKTWAQAVKAAAAQGLRLCTPEEGLALCEQWKLPVGVVTVFPVKGTAGLMHLRAEGGEARLEGRSVHIGTNPDWYVPLVQMAA